MSHPLPIEEAKREIALRHYINQYGDSAAQIRERFIRSRSELRLEALMVRQRRSSFPNLDAHTQRLIERQRQCPIL